jgi:GAF domain-containing protein/biotin carboxyl carrier protein
MLGLGASDARAQSIEEPDGGEHAGAAEGPEWAGDSAESGEDQAPEDDEDDAGEPDWRREGDDAEPESYEHLWGEAEDAPGSESAAGESESDPSAAPAFELYLPLRVEDEVLGVLALGPRVDGQAYRADDVQLARSLSAHLALALNHAALFAERSRRIEQLSVLLRISREITSTLDLDRVLHTVAQMMALVVPNRRTVLALTSARGVSLRASSDPEFRPKESGRDPFLPILQWAHDARQHINTHRAALEGDSEAEGRDLLLPWLSRERGPRGLAVVPLEDDQGVLGLLAIETESDALPLDEDREELVTILANQTTVAIRNAELYQQVPMIGFLEPILGKARRARAAGSRRLLTRAGVVIALLAAGFLIPIPAWVSGDAQLRPFAPIALHAATEGTVDEVLVREGQEIRSGTVVARLRRDEFEVQVEQTRAEARRAQAEAAQARVAGDLSTYRARQAKLGELKRVEQFLISELERTVLVAPSDGVVLTQDVERRRGDHLRRGETLLELADLAAMEVEVSLAGHDIRSVAPGSRARLKVQAYPGRTFRGEVTRIAPRSDRDGTFRVTVRLPNADRALRPGMTGRAHLEIPPRPPLVSFFAPVVRRLRLGLWL